ncbi:MAG: glycoside hydrolase family 3 C-terminal domain-containing protein [Actinobacteria bacterium]|nr:glycoside hydrolase family 3 C-terminal domain-containing protein [Actinomycetota bacterium]
MDGDTGRLAIDHLLGELTVEEKAALCSGSGFWHTRAVERLGVPAIAVSDGPHGLRVQRDGGDHLGIDSSDPATCFPPAVTLGSTWNVEMVRRVGEAIGVEARSAGLAVVLGPGVNIKRSPLCGRNFEYYSEDPLVASTMGTAWVDGLQSTGVGASLKHFAVNNQETDRLRVSADVDERTLREIYLAAFEPVVRDAQPWTVMCSYNRINGTYAASDRWLLTEVLREAWGFEGLVVSDWGAVDDPVASVAAGLDLEMPSSGGASAASIVAAVRDGSLDVADVDTAVRRVLQLVDHAPRTASAVAFDVDAHHAIARAAAGEGAVLLQNDGGVLPLRPAAGQRVAVIGELARTPRYQGAGSSQVNPTRVDDALRALEVAFGPEVDVRFAPGYRLDDEVTDSEAASLVAEAIATATDADAVVIFAGLPGPYESEGFDRVDLDLPACQLEVIDAIARLRSDATVVLANGGVVAVDAFASSVAAILECWLGGQASGTAVADLLSGAVNPSGKLTESIPHRLADTPARHNFPGEDRHVRYGEGLFVGYRHFDSAEVSVAFPFGHGLSYTTFAYSDLTVDVLDDGIDVALDEPVVEIAATVTNTGSVAGAEVVQVYVAPKDALVVRPVHELRAFAKVALAPGAAERVNFALTRRDLARWSVRAHDWVFDPGVYGIEVGASSRDLPLAETVTIPGAATAAPLDDYSSLGEWLAHPIGHDVLVEQLRSSPLGDLTPLLADEGTIKVISQFPLRRLIPMLGGSFTQDDLVQLVDRVNASG